MPSRTHRFFQSPLRVTLILHSLACLATLAFLIAAILLAQRPGAPSDGYIATLASALRPDAAGQGGLTLFWTLLIPLGLMLVAVFILGLVYGKWGLPGHLLGRSVYFVPPAAAVWLGIGWFVIVRVASEDFGPAWGSLRSMFTTYAGLTLVLFYAALTTSAVGLGWAAALLVTRIKRVRGKWETIGYVERSA